MSLSRIGEEAKYFGEEPGYVYLRDDDMFNGYKFNTKIRDPVHFCELAMRSLEQSGELDEEELEQCEKALRQRFDYVFEEE